MKLHHAPMKLHQLSLNFGHASSNFHRPRIFISKSPMSGYRAWNSVCRRRSGVTGRCEKQRRADIPVRQSKGKGGLENPPSFVWSRAEKADRNVRSPFFDRDRCHVTRCRNDIFAVCIVGKKYTNLPKHAAYTRDYALAENRSAATSRQSHNQIGAEFVESDCFAVNT